MAKKISSWLSFLIMLATSQAALAESEVVELFISCADVERIEIYKTAEDMSVAAKGDNPDCPGNCYLTVVRLTEEAMQKYLAEIDAMEWGEHKLILEGEVFYAFPDGRDSYRKYAHLVDNSKAGRYLVPSMTAFTYGEALRVAEKYCPALVVRGEENILTEVPYK